MKGAIVGFGTIAMGHTVGYSKVDGLDIVAVVDPSPGRRAHATRHFGFRSYLTFQEMLDHEDLDFIDVCAPPSAHVDYIRIAMANGLHVLCEKPLALPSDHGYDELLAEIRSSEKVVYPCHNYKFAPILKLMESIVRQPQFGNVLSAKFRTQRSGHAVGVAEWEPHWRRYPALSGGGILRDHGPHSIYLAAHLTGRSPVAVSCLTGNLRGDKFVDTEDTALLTIRCEDNVQIMLDLTWSAGFRNSYYAIVGSNGSVTVENDDVSYAVGGELVRTVLPSDFDDPSHSDWFSQVFLDFLDKVAHPETADELLQEAIMTCVVIDSAYESASVGGLWVDVKLPIVPAPFQRLQ